MSEPSVPLVRTNHSLIPAKTRRQKPKSLAISPKSSKRLPTNPLTLPTGEPGSAFSGRGSCGD